MNSISNSLVFAGVAGGVVTLPASAAQLVDATSSILSFNTRTPAGFSNTFISAATIKTAAIRGAAAVSAGGIAAVHFGSLTFTQPHHKAVHFSTKKAGAIVPVLADTDFVISVLS